jgi:predicted nucleic acid-binding protein
VVPAGAAGGVSPAATCSRRPTALLEALRDFDEHISSRLLRIELRRLALRHDVLADADRLLSAVAVVPLDAAVLEAAETVPPASVATLDAVHLAAALRLAADGAIEAIVTYDAGLAEGARHHRLEVLAPAPI